MSSGQIHLVRELVALRGWTAATPLPERRRLFEQARHAFATEVSATVRLVRAGSRPAEWLVPAGADEGRVVLYFHGGAYVLGSPQSHRHLAAALGESAAAAVLVPDYRLAPEHPFPAAVDDALAAYHWLLGVGVAPVRVAVAGDSAGGGLALALLLRLREAGEPLPAAGVLVSPWADLTCASGSHTHRAAADPVLRSEELRRMAELYLGGADAHAPLASPVFADLQGLPPLLVQVGSDEVLFDDARRVAQRATAAGVDVRFEEWPEMIHVWHWYFPLLEEGRAALAAAGRFLRTHLGAAVSVVRCRACATES